jgi:hypothetical protein
LRSPFGAIRTAALRDLLSGARDDQVSLAEHALFDVQRSAREIAMWYLTQRGHRVAQYYASKLRQEILAARQTQICLTSLASCGTLEDVELIKRFANVPQARTQAAAIMTWARLVPAARDEIAQFALRSDFPRVRKLALVLANDFGAYLDLDEAITLAKSRGDHKLALAFGRRQHWTWITTIVAYADLASSPLSKEDLLVELRGWINASSHIYTKPTADQARQLTSAATKQLLSNLMGADAVSSTAALPQIFALHCLV